MNTSDRAEEARKVAEAASSVHLGEEASFPLEPQFHGRGLEIIEGARRILISEGEGHIVLTLQSPDLIHIQA